MTILAFKSFDKPMDLIKPRLFIAMFNPTSYKVESNITKDDRETAGGETQTATAQAVSLKTMTFDFVIDGTGASGEKRIVLLETRNFEKVVMPENSANGFVKLSADAGKKIELPKLLLTWGTFIFTCEIESYTINYTLFDTFGIPLRATITATFKERDPKLAKNLLDLITENPVVEQITNAASFLSAAYSVTNNIAKTVDMAREENLNSIRQKIQ